jgi:hypothetical protein
VNDGFEDSGVDTAIVSTTNSAPVADAGPDQALLLGQSATLDGSASSDADGHPLTFSWTFVSVPTGSNPALTAPDSTAPLLEPDRPGTYVLQLIVHDGFVASAPDTVRVEVTQLLPVVSIESTDGEAAELGRDPGTFTIRRTGPGNEVVVLLRLSGSATDGEDFETLGSDPILVTLPAGASSAEVTVVPRPDNLVEQPPETVTLTIEPDPTYIVGPREATVTIADDPPVVTIVAGDPNAIEFGPDGPDTGRFDVTRSGGDTSVPLTVAYEVSGTATSGIDYVDLAGNPAFVSIPALESTAHVFVVPLPDGVADLNETVEARLVTSLQYVVGTPGSAVVVIR